jgi:acetyltransferase
MNEIQLNQALTSPYIASWPLVHGGNYLIRPISPDDKNAVLDLFNHLSPQSRYFRYAHAISTLPEDLLQQIIHATSVDNFALVAMIKKTNEPDRLVGISRYIKDTDHAKGEFSLSVSDDYHHEGIGAQLMRGIIDCAKLNGLSEIYGYVSKDNQEMLMLMRHLEFTLIKDEDDPKTYIASHMTAS